MVHLLLIYIVKVCVAKPITWRTSVMCVNKSIMIGSLILALTAGCGKAVSGANGKDGSNGADGSQGEQGEAGEKGAKGDTGSQGPQGNTGSSGVPGLPGTNGSSVTIVQLCPNQPHTIYGAFPEMAFCIANKLYGVYNDGLHPLAFLAELAPGDYRSVVPLGCNLKVKLNCVVEQN